MENTDITGNEFDAPRVESLENQTVKEKGNHSGLWKNISLATGVVILGLGVAFYPVIKDRGEFREACNQAVRQYGDTNKDGFVSAEENDTLFRNIFYKTGIQVTSDGLKNTTSRDIPVSELTQRVRNYIEHPTPLR
jgi:hypothetical protein